MCAKKYLVMAKKMLGTIGFIKNHKHKKPKQVIVYEKTVYSIDRKQEAEALRRLSEGEVVEFFIQIPFVATIKSIKFDKTEFEEFYEENLPL